MSSKDVEITEKNDKTEIKIEPFNFVVRFDDDQVEVVIAGNTQMMVDGNFYIGVNGEMGLMSNGEPIHIDSLNSNIHLNSRKSKILKDLPESEEYRNKIEEQRKIQENQLFEEHQNLIDRIKRLEQEVKELKCQEQQD